MVRDASRCGVRSEATTAGARWRYERYIPDEVYFRATDAVP